MFEHMSAAERIQAAKEKTERVVEKTVVKEVRAED